MAKVTLKISINGTDKNPYARYGLKHNPFPQTGEAGYTAAEMALNSLGGEPIKSIAEIRARFGNRVSEELIRLCEREYKPGLLVRFRVTFDDAKPLNIDADIEDADWTKHNRKG